MSDESVSVEYFQHLLTSLTLNSRALIVELTALAEKLSDNAADIVSAIEVRIGKILPKYKLYSFYLMDSIIKNIGNPYNVLFATNLYRTFTETYSIVDDTNTRQNLINLFKTWMTGKTVSGLDLFPQEVLLRIEKFIIKATSLNNASPQDISRVTRDGLLREGNYLLQYIISLDNELELIEAGKLSPEQMKLTHTWRQTRNNCVYEINTISEAVMTQRKQDFETLKEQSFSSLQNVRKLLDDQRLQQQELGKTISEAAAKESEKAAEQTRLQLNRTPKNIDILMIFEGKTNDASFISAVEQWGNKHVIGEPEANTGEGEQGGNALASTFGLDMSSFGLGGSILGVPQLEIAPSEPANSTSEASYESDEDGYDPELTITEIEARQSPPTSPVKGRVFAGKSSLKRPNDLAERLAKRVRFDV